MATMPVIDRSAHEDEHLHRVRHSLAHVLAQAVQRLYPGATLGFGPPTEHGFHYDFVIPPGGTVSDADLERIEAVMHEILTEDQPFTRENLPLPAALGRLNDMGEPYKAEYVEELAGEGTGEVSFYRNGPFIDLCRGPHVVNTRDIDARGFALVGVGGAYWRGDESRTQMTRISGLAFADGKELRRYIRAVEEERKNDHRILGRDLAIFTAADEVGKGLPLWLPNGAAIRHELEKLAYEWEFAAGYQQVATPHIAREELYLTSGHLPLYADDMYPPLEAVDGDEPGGSERYYLKPMNCPHHHLIYRSRPRSYRELPLRLSEYGDCYRFERAGALQGLTRVRGMRMNDAHIYVTPEQLKEEFKAVMELHRRYYELFGFTDYYLKVAEWDANERRAKYVDDPEGWESSQEAIKEALDELGLFYTVETGGAAFYGPKVDYEFRTAAGREFSATTNQLDFAVPARFGLSYVDADGTARVPYCIHRAPLGSHERFIAILIEHYKGAFPLWLAPRQVVVLPVADTHRGFAERVRSELRSRMVRAEVDEAAATLGRRIRGAIAGKVPIVAVVGDDEVDSESVNVRRYGSKVSTSDPLEAFVDSVVIEIDARTDYLADRR